MAELVLGVAGVVLAWKGILDFGDLIIRLMDDDSRRREGLAIRLEVSQYMLKDWGEHWGLTRDDGRFHSLEASRKGLILKIITRLHNSRMKALTVLKDRYGLTLDKDSITAGERLTNDDIRLSKMVERARGASKRLKEKGAWHLHDRAELTELVAETMELLGDLQYLTYGSSKLTQNIMAGIPTESTAITRDEGQGPRPTQVITALLPNEQSSATIDPPSLLPAYAPGSLAQQEDSDARTMVSDTFRSIISSSQAEHIQFLMDQSFDFHGDVRIGEAIVLWWKFDTAATLLIEAPGFAEDDAAAIACATVYRLAQGPKLIYSFQDEHLCDLDPPSQLAEMLQILILRMAMIAGEYGITIVQPPANFSDHEYAQPVLDKVSDRIKVFQSTIKALLLRLPHPVLLILDGIDVIADSRCSGLAPMLHLFLKGLMDIPHSMANVAAGQARLKMLLTSRGHLPAVYEFMDGQDILDITAYPQQVVNLMQELLSSLF